MDELISTADSLMVIWQWDEAYDLYSKANLAYKSDENHEAFIYTLNQMGAISCALKSFDECFRLQKAALQANRHFLSPPNAEMARTFYNLGYYYFDRPNRNPDSSFFYRNQALQMRLEILLPDHPDLAESYHQMARTYQAMDKLNLAKTYHEKANRIFRKTLGPNSLLLAKSSRNFAITLRQIGELGRAKYFLFEALNIYKNHPEAPVSEISNACNTLGNVHHNLQEYHKAETFYMKAVNTMSQAFGPLSRNVILSVTNLATNYVLQEEWDKARILFKRAIRINTEAQTPDSIWLSYSYFQYGEFFLLQSMGDSAIYFLDKALSIQQNMPGRSNLEYTRLLNYKARAESVRKNFGQALRTVQSAMIILEPTFDNRSFLSSPDLDKVRYPDQLYLLLSTKAAIYASKYEEYQQKSDLEVSLDIYRLLDRLTDDIRNGKYSEETQLYIAGHHREEAENALKVLAKLNRLDPKFKYCDLALQFMEKNRYVKIFSNLSKLESSSSYNLPDSIRDQELYLKENLLSKKNQLIDAHDSLPSSLLREIVGLEGQYDAFRNKISRLHPQYFHVRYDKMLALDALMKSVDPGTTLMEYFVGETEIWLTYFSQNRAGFMEIPLDDELLSDILWFQNRISLTTPEEGIDKMDLAVDSFIRKGYNIYKTLVLPFVESDNQKIIFSLDGILALIPFDILVISDKKSNFRNAPYLFRECDINYVYSSNLLFKTTVKSPLSRLKILAMAYSDPAQAATTLNRDFSDELPESAREVQSIDHTFKGHPIRLFRGEEATESYFKQYAGQSNLIHFAVHGLSDEQNELHSHLKFKNARDSINDGLLHAYELYNLDLGQLRLAVLSACETGIGRNMLGEGLFSMARGFMFKGCPAVVMSLWKVNDKSTADVMTLFYEYLSLGMSIDKALKNAKLDFIADLNNTEFLDPFYWAAFVPLGDNTPIVFQKSRIPWLAVLLSFATLLILWKIKSALRTKYNTP